MLVFHFNLKNNDGTKTYINADLNFFASNSIQIINNGFTGFYIDILTEKSDDVSYDSTTGTLTLPIKIKGLSKTINATSPDSDYEVGKSFFPSSGSSDIYYTVEDTSTPTYSFKHLYSGKSIEPVPIKFKSYTQTKPVTGETWVLNETLPSTYQGSGDYSANFVSNGTTYTYINFNGKPNGIRYQNSTGEFLVYSWVDNTWTDQAYRTITFSTAPTDDLLTLLQAYGVKQ